MKRSVRRLWWLSILTVAGCLAGAPEPAQEDVPTVTRSIECRWASGRLRIDGKIDEKSWADAMIVNHFVVFWEKRKARTATEARLLWDDRYLYFSAIMDDADLYGTVKERNGITWNDDVFELFFKPSVDKANEFPLQYYEFQVNVLNTQLELFMPSRGAGGYNRFGPLTKLGMESAVQFRDRRDTLNDYRDRDKGWTVEGRIPWTAFKAAGGKPKPGDKWRFALCRYDYSVAFERPDLSSTAPLTVPDFHHYEDYNELVFVGPKD
jgi:hypothetical protein